ncbi:MAG TPA: hypothetical protein QKA08_01140 [Candidatus Megaira endosymbiont of Nemacystus decipiens]|nr:hypothetical protein [Candidatus Megaera endosymbiont of Nemacystus decipiens]
MPIFKKKTPPAQNKVLTLFGYNKKIEEIEKQTLKLQENNKLINKKIETEKKSYNKKKQDINTKIKEVRARTNNIDKNLKIIDNLTKELNSLEPFYNKNIEKFKKEKGKNNKNISTLNESHKSIVRKQKDRYLMLTQRQNESDKKELQEYIKSEQGKAIEKKKRKEAKEKLIQKQKEKGKNTYEKEKKSLFNALEKISNNPEQMSKVINSMLEKPKDQDEVIKIGSTLKGAANIGLRNVFSLASLVTSIPYYLEEKEKISKIGRGTNESFFIKLLSDKDTQTFLQKVAPNLKTISSNITPELVNTAARALTQTKKTQDKINKETKRIYSLMKQNQVDAKALEKAQEKLAFESSDQKLQTLNKQILDLYKKINFREEQIKEIDSNLKLLSAKKAIAKTVNQVEKEGFDSGYVGKKLAPVVEKLLENTTDSPKYITDVLNHAVDLYLSQTREDMGANVIKIISSDLVQEALKTEELVKFLNEEKQLINKTAKHIFDNSQGIKDRAEKLGITNETVMNVADAGANAIATALPFSVDLLNALSKQEDSVIALMNETIAQAEMLAGAIDKLKEDEKLNIKDVTKPIFSIAPKVITLMQDDNVKNAFSNLSDKISQNDVLTSSVATAGGSLLSAVTPTIKTVDNLDELLQEATQVGNKILSNTLNHSNEILAIPNNVLKIIADPNDGFVGSNTKQSSLNKVISSASKILKNEEVNEIFTKDLVNLLDNHKSTIGDLASELLIENETINTKLQSKIDKTSPLLAQSRLREIKLNKELVKNATETAVTAASVILPSATKLTQALSKQGPEVIEIVKLTEGMLDGFKTARDSAVNEKKSIDTKEVIQEVLPVAESAIELLQDKDVKEAIKDLGETISGNEKLKNSLVTMTNTAIDNLRPDIKRIYGTDKLIKDGVELGQNILSVALRHNNEALEISQSGLSMTQSYLSKEGLNQAALKQIVSSASEILKNEEVNKVFAGDLAKVINDNKSTIGAMASELLLENEAISSKIDDAAKKVSPLFEKAGMENPKLDKYLVQNATETVLTASSLILPPAAKFTQAIAEQEEKFSELLVDAEKLSKKIIAQKNIKDEKDPADLLKDTLSITKNAVELLDHEKSKEALEDLSNNIVNEELKTSLTTTINSTIKILRPDIIDIKGAPNLIEESVELGQNILSAALKHNNEALEISQSALSLIQGYPNLSALLKKNQEEIPELQGFNEKYKTQINNTIDNLGSIISSEESKNLIENLPNYINKNKGTITAIVSNETKKNGDAIEKLGLSEKFINQSTELAFSLLTDDKVIDTLSKIVTIPQNLQKSEEGEVSPITKIIDNIHNALIDKEENNRKHLMNIVSNIGEAMIKNKDYRTAYDILVKDIPEILKTHQNEIASLLEEFLDNTEIGKQVDISMKDALKVAEKKMPNLIALSEKYHKKNYLGVVAEGVKLLSSPVVIKFIAKTSGRTIANKFRNKESERIKKPSKKTSSRGL